MTNTVRSRDGLNRSRRSSGVPDPPPYLGVTTVMAPVVWSAAVIEVESVVPGGVVRCDDHDLAETVLLSIGGCVDVAAVERRRRIVATYRWLLGQLFDPATVTLVVCAGDADHLASFLAHSGDPAPGGIVARGGACRRLDRGTGGLDGPVSDPHRCDPEPEPRRTRDAVLFRPPAACHKPMVAPSLADPGPSAMRIVSPGLENPLNEGDRA